MIRKTFALCGLVSCALGVSAVAIGAEYKLLPPASVTVDVDVVDVKDTLMSPGGEYWIFVDAIGAADPSTYFASVYDTSGTELYDAVPVRTKNCSDSSVSWPSRTIAHVMRGDEGRIELVAYTYVLNSCLLILDLDLAGEQRTLPAEPNAGRPLG